MCRFLLVKTDHPRNYKELLQKFSHMTLNSKALDGDWQGDGWGASWLDDEHEWQEHRSIRPIWDDEHWFEHIPKTRFLLVHARSASFPHHKRKLFFNQPFTNEKYAYVFNGLLKGVTFPYPVEGEIGSQKIWSLLTSELTGNKPEIAIDKVKDLLAQHTQHIQALNIGLSDRKNLYAYTLYSAHPEYYNLQIHDTPHLKMICSEHLPGYEFYPAHKEKVITL